MSLRLALANAPAPLPPPRTPCAQATFFGHFCAGRSAEEIQPVLQRLQKDGVGSILDYAAEDEIEEKAQRHLGVSPDQIQVRTYDYQGEEQCDFNLEVTLRSIDTAAQLSKVTGLPGFAAVKVTSIGKPELLQHISQAMSENRSLFLRQFLGEDTSHIGPEGQGSSDDSDEDSEVEISALAGGLVLGPPRLAETGAQDSFTHSKSWIRRTKTKHTAR